MPLPTVILPGYLAPARDYFALEQFLIAQGFPTVTVPLTRQSWLITLGGRPVTPILEVLDQTVRSVLAETKSKQVNLIGHSAGGWISRIYLGAESYYDRAWSGHPLVKTLVTLGTPHTSQERWSRRNIDFVGRSYPGTFFPEIEYVSIAGKALYGKPSWRLREWFTYKSYQLTCGQGNCWGDGVIPIESAHLVGAKNIILENVQHSPRTIPANAQHQWYGSPDVVAQWIEHLR